MRRGSTAQDDGQATRSNLAKSRSDNQHDIDASHRGREMDRFRRPFLALAVVGGARAHANGATTPPGAILMLESIGQLRPVISKVKPRGLVAGVSCIPRIQPTLLRQSAVLLNHLFSHDATRFRAG